MHLTVKLVLFLILGLLTAFVCRFLISTALFLDLNKQVFNHRPGQCRKVEGIERGSEDVELIESKGIAFVSSGVLDYAVAGEIFVYNINDGDFKAKKVEVVGVKDTTWHPHGMSHWMLPDGTVRLFVISHSKERKHSVVLLDYEERGNRLAHYKTVEDDTITRPNDLAALGEDSFLVGNDGKSNTKIGNTLEIAVGANAGSIVYYDGKTARRVLADVPAVNGISFSRDLTKLFVAHVYLKEVHVYNWMKSGSSLSLNQTVAISTMPDNFYVDEHNAVYLGAHPITRQVMKFLGDHDNRNVWTPTQILRIHFSSDFNRWDIREVFSDDGRFVCGGSVGVVHNGHIVIGTIGRTLVDCDISNVEDFNAVQL